MGEPGVNATVGSCHPNRVSWLPQAIGFPNSPANRLSSTWLWFLPNQNGDTDIIPSLIPSLTAIFHLPATDMDCQVCDSPDFDSWSKHFRHMILAQSPAPDTCERCKVIIEGVRLLQPRLAQARLPGKTDKLQLQGDFRDRKSLSHVGVYQGGQTRFLDFYVLPGMLYLHPWKHRWI